MAIKFLNNISLENLELQNAKLHLVDSTNPNLTGADYEGRVIYNKADNAIYFHNGGSSNGTQWVKLDGTGDISAVNTGTGSGLSGGTTSGAADLQVVVDTTTIEISTNTIQAVTGTIADGGTNLVTSDAIFDYIAANTIPGNESISLSGDVTGSGTTAITTTISDTAVTFAKMQNIADNTIIGRIGQSSAGVASEIDTTEFIPYLKSALAGGFGSNAVSIGDSDDVVTVTYKLSVGDNADVGGALGVTGALSVTSASELTGGITVDTDKFTVSTAGAIASKSNLSIDGNASIGGDLTVTGTVISTQSERIDLEDSVILLNSNATGSAADTADAGLTVERGSDTNVSLLWDEGTNRWTFSNDGSTFYNIPISTEYNNYSHHTQSAISIDGGGLDFVADVEVNTEGHVTSISTATIQSTSASQKGVVELATDAEAKTGTDTNRAVTPANVQAVYAGKSFIADLDSTISGNPVNYDSSTFEYEITHSLGSFNVLVQLIDISGSTPTYDTVFADITRTTNQIVKAKFAAAPTEGDYRILINRLD